MHPAERAVSVIAGGLLVGAGIGKRSFGRGAIGAELLRRGITGHCYAYEALGVRTAPRGQGQSVSVPYELGVRLGGRIVIDRRPDEVYRFWRNLGNLATFMKHVESVRETEGKRSHWKVRTNSGRTFEWDAVINNELANELIAWRSLPGAGIDNAGSVWFKPTPDGRGTEVRVEMQFNPPGGAVGATMAKWWGDDPDRQLEEDLNSLKRQLESTAPVNVG